MSFADETDVLFRALFKHSSDAMVLVDASGRIALGNDACERLLGHPVASILGEPVEKLVPRRFGRHEQERAGYARDPSPRAMGQGLRLYALHASGQEIPVDIALTPLVVAGRQWFGCAIRDMRGRPWGPETLRVQATALWSAANGIVITDRAGVITWVNPAACAMTGYGSEELIGRHTRLLKSNQHDAEFYAGLWRTIGAGETWSGTIINRRRDGTLYHEEQTIAPVLDDAGQVSNFIAIKQDVSARRRDEEALARAHAQLAVHVREIESLNGRLREEAIRDPLTHLHNRRFLEDAAARDAARAVRSGESLAVVTIDVDRFKSVNDSHGHAAGDGVLQALASVLRERARASDLICRFGGEEFVAVLPGASLPAALARAEQWRSAFENLAIETEAGAPLRCTISIGVAVFGGEGDSIASTLARADAALYEAKHSGRNRVVAAR